MKAIVKETGQVVTITGTTEGGKRYRVFLGGSNMDMRYDWYYEHELTFLNKEAK